MGLAELFYVDSAPLDDALKRADGNRLVRVNRDYHLATVNMSPLLMVSPLARELEPVPLNDLDDVSRGANAETVGSRNRDFQNLCAFGEVHRSRLKPQSERFLRVCDRFLLRITRARASGKLGKYGGPPLSFRIELDDDAQLHRQSLSQFAGECTVVSPTSHKKPGRGSRNHRANRNSQFENSRASPPALLRADPVWTPLRTDPRFQKLCEG